jgi:hypothetical protein
MPQASDELSRSTHQAPLAANRLGLILDAGEESRVGLPLEPLPDEGPENDLKAHRELQRGCRLPGEDPGPVQDVLRENEEDLRLILEHHHLLLAQPLLTGRERLVRQLYINYS